MNILFWNLNQQVRVAEICALFIAHQCDMAVFAEYVDDDAEVLSQLRAEGVACCFLQTIGCSRIKILAKTSFDFFSIKKESERYTFRELNLPGKIPTLFCMIHFHSKLHADNNDQMIEAAYLKTEIESTEAELGHKNTMVFGDFNMNPFDAGMYFANAMNSVPCKYLAQSSPRNINGREHSYFYNPSWNLLGDRNEVPGSYYYGGGKYSKMHWNTLDQLIVRPDLSGRLVVGSLRILTSAGGENLLSPKRRPRLSDHFPMFFSMNLSLDFDLECEDGKFMA